MGSRTILLENSSEQDVIGVERYKLRFCGGNKLLLHNALYAPRVRCSLVSFISLMRISFSLVIHPNCLYIFYNGNLFDHATSEGDYIVLNLNDNYDNTSSIFISYFNSDSESVK